MKYFYPAIILTLFVVSCSPPLPFSEDGTETFYRTDLAPFYHGVASGDPLEDRVIIWTRVTPPHHRPIKVEWEVAPDRDFAEIVRNGSTMTDSLRDYTVKIDVDQLTANFTYYYRFKALNATSVTGQTKTTNNSGTGQIKLGVVSCSNYEFGYFAAYRHLADKELDAVIHLGDYFYEYGPGVYGDSTVDRSNLPTHEIITLADYRTRYALYRLDKDLQYIHRKHPFIAIWDDHEITNNSHKSGAQNHQDDEGDYEVRKAVAKQAYYEWLPIRPNEKDVLYREFKYDGMVDLIVLDERLEGRSEQAKSLEDVDASLTMLGASQLAWFKDKLKSSKAKWKVIGNQVIFSVLDLADVRPSRPKNLDAWDGYAFERDEILDYIDQNDLDNIIFLTGDTHTSWAFEVPRSIEDYNISHQGLALEFGTTSITSANWNEGNPDEEVIQAENAVLESNPHLKYLQARDHGYLILTLSSDEARAEWYYVDNIKDEQSGERLAKTIRVLDGSTTLISE